MIIKYRNGDAWGYVDNLTNVVYEDFSMQDKIDQYYSIPKEERENDHVVSEEYSDKVNTGNLIFYTLMVEVEEELEEYAIHHLNLLDYDYLPNENGETTSANIIANYSNREEFDKVNIITNQRVYLLNDKGETIERLN